MRGVAKNQSSGSRHALRSGINSRAVYIGTSPTHASGESFFWLNQISSTPRISLFLRSMALSFRQPPFSTRSCAQSLECGFRSACPRFRQRPERLATHLKRNPTGVSLWGDSQTVDHVIQMACRRMEADSYFEGTFSGSSGAGVAGGGRQVPATARSRSSMK